MLDWLTRDRLIGAASTALLAWIVGGSLLL